MMMMPQSPFVKAICKWTVECLVLATVAYVGFYWNENIGVVQECLGMLRTDQDQPQQAADDDAIRAAVEQIYCKLRLLETRNTLAHMEEPNVVAANHDSGNEEQADEEDGDVYYDEQAEENHSFWQDEHIEDDSDGDLESDDNENQIEDDNLWELRFNELVEYRDTYGDCIVPKNFSENRRLARWVRHQRLLVQDESTLQYIQLNNIGFIWNISEHVWDNRFQALLRYKEKTGDSSVPLRDGRLGLWAAYQRRRRSGVYKDGDFVPHEEDAINEDDNYDEPHFPSLDHIRQFTAFCSRLRKNHVEATHHSVVELCDDHFAFQLAEALYENTSLKNVVITLLPDVTSAGAKALARGIQRSSIKVLSLRIHDFDDTEEGLSDSQSSVLGWICRRIIRTVWELSIHSELGGLEALKIGQVLHHDSRITMLEALHLNCQFVYEEGAHKLFEGIRSAQIAKLELDEVHPRFCRFLFSAGVLQLPALRDLKINAVNNAATDGSTLRDWDVFGGMTACPVGSDQMSALKTLKINLNNCMRNREAHFLSNGMRGYANLNELRLGENAIEDEGVGFLIKRWDDWKQLKFLDLSSNRVTVAGMRNLLMAASTHPSIESLDLSWNLNNGHDCMRHFAQDEIRNPLKLVNLNLGGCGLDDAGIDALVKGLNRHSSIKRLGLDYNNIGDKGVELLVESMDNGLLLDELCLSRNKLGANGVLSLMRLTSTYPSLRELDLSSCKRIRFKSLALIANELKLSKLLKLTLHVEAVHFANNKSQKAKAQQRACKMASAALVNAVKCNTHLQELDVDLIDIRMEAKQEIKFLLGVAKSVRQLLRLDEELDPFGLWCHVLAKCGTNCSLVFYMIGEKPSLIPSFENVTEKRRRGSNTTDGPPHKRRWFRRGC